MTGTAQRRFPIQGEWSERERRHIAPTTIPWDVAERAYEGYLARFGRHHQQSLERLAERGGFGRDELVLLLSHAPEPRP